MNRIILAEWRKATLRFLPYGMFALALGYLALTLAVVPVLASALPAEASGGQDLTAYLANVKAPGGFVFAAQQTVGQAAVFVVILVGISVANEYGWGTLTVTFVLEPRRSRVLWAKLAALAGLALAGTVALFAAALVMIAAIQPLVPSDVSSSMTGAWSVPAIRSFLLGLPSVVVWVCVATALAVATRNAGAAAGLGVAISFGEGFLQLVPFIRPVLLSSNTQALQAVPGVDLTGGFFGSSGAIPAWRAWLVLAAWAAVSVSVSAWLLRRRDVA